MPTLLPLLFHWYEGELPPLVGVAVSVTGWPMQVGFEPEVTAMVTEGALLLVILIVTALDVAVAGLAHDEFEVISTVITSPLAGV